MHSFKRGDIIECKTWQDKLRLTKIAEEHGVFIIDELYRDYERGKIKLYEKEHDEWPNLSYNGGFDSNCSKVSENNPFNTWITEDEFMFKCGVKTLKPFRVLKKHTFS